MEPPNLDILARAVFTEEQIQVLKLMIQHSGGGSNDQMDVIQENLSMRVEAVENGLDRLEAELKRRGCESLTWCSTVKRSKPPTGRSELERFNRKRSESSTTICRRIQG